MIKAISVSEHSTLTRGCLMLLYLNTSTVHKIMTKLWCALVTLNVSSVHYVKMSTHCTSCSLTHPLRHLFIRPYDFSMSTLCIMMATFTRCWSHSVVALCTFLVQLPGEMGEVRGGTKGWQHLCLRVWCDVCIMATMLLGLAPALM